MSITSPIALVSADRSGSPEAEDTDVDLLDEDHIPDVSPNKKDVSMFWYASFVTKYPWVVLLLTFVIGLSSCVTFYYHPMPSFSNPIEGFEARKTEISDRSVTVQKLLYTASNSASLRYSFLPNISLVIEKIPGYTGLDLDTKFLSEMAKSFFPSVARKKRSTGDELTYIKTETKELHEYYPEPTRAKRSLVRNPNEQFVYQSNEECWHYLKDSIDPSLTKLVYSSIDENTDLFTSEAMHDICRSEDKFIQPDLENILKSRGLSKIFFGPNDTIPDLRCRSHSLPWYTLLVLGKESCFDIDNVDMLKIKNLLALCYPLYQSGALQDPSVVTNLQTQFEDATFHFNLTDCYTEGYVYNMFEYVIDESFFQKTKTQGLKLGKLKHTLLLAHTLQKMPFGEYFRTVFNGQDMTTGSVKIVGFFRAVGRKMALFSEYMARDTWLFGLAVGFILFIMLLYLQSTALVLATLMNIAFSFSIAYFFYHVAFRIHFFPFMNLLSGIVIIAVAADDVFIFYDIWHKIKREHIKDGLRSNPKNLSKNDYAMVASETFRHATAAIFVTSFTTASAFFANCVSSITVIKCFGIFSGTVILANFFLMITWTPSVVILIEQISEKFNFSFKWCSFLSSTTVYTQKLEAKLFGQFIPKLITKFWLPLIIFFLAVGVSGFIAIFYWPKLHLPTDKYVQLFTRGSTMLLENYEKTLQYNFPFAVQAQEQEYNKMKIQFVWGVHPKDNGDTFDSHPADSATLLPDKSFNMTSIEAQSWLINFCHDVLNQSFIDEPTTCVFDYYLQLLKNKCGDQKYGMMLMPCCDIESFPVKPEKLEFCLPILDGVTFVILANQSKHTHSRKMDAFYKVSGRPIFDKRTNNPTALLINIFTNIRASSDYGSMIKAYNRVNNYTQNTLMTAPVGLKNGWWGSYPDLVLYDLQRSLENGVFYSIIASLSVTLAMMLITSLNFLITIFAGVTIVLVISSSLGCLVLSGWVLNVIESVTLSLAVGLSIDFTIHYGVSYKLSHKKSSKDKMQDSVSKVGSAVAMAALTTFAAGAAMMPTQIIAYKELGSFLMVVMAFSWIFSTFFFQAVCRIIGPTGNFCHISCNVCKILRNCSERIFGKRKLFQRQNYEYSNTALLQRHTESDDELLNELLNEFEYADDVPVLR